MPPGIRNPTLTSTTSRQPWTKTTWCQHFAGFPKNQQPRLAVATIAELMTSLKDEILARYKSPFWGPAVLVLFAAHWKIALFLLLDKPSASQAISFVQENASLERATWALAFAVTYVIAFPWFELALSRASSYGRRSRNDFQIREREREIGSRRRIALQEAAAVELELKNKEDQSKLSDIELARSYQSIISGPNFARWLKDAQQGAINSSLNNSIVNYLEKVDSIEGHFINPVVGKAHEQFVEAISLLHSTINDSRPMADEGKKSDLLKATAMAQQALQEYRKEARDLLGI